MLGNRIAPPFRNISLDPEIGTRLLLSQSENSILLATVIGHQPGNLEFFPWERFSLWGKEFLMGYGDVI